MVLTSKKKEMLPVFEKPYNPDRKFMTKEQAKEDNVKYREAAQKIRNIQEELGTSLLNKRISLKSIDTTNETSLKESVEKEVTTSSVDVKVNPFKKTVKGV